MPPVRMRGDGRKAKNPRKTLLRLLGYMKPYLPTLGVVLLCIIANAVAQTTGSRSLGTLVDSYILPMVRDGSTDFSSLWGYLSKLACIFAVGMISSFLFMFLMVKVSQGTQKHIRDEMFAHMQTLPLRYFDTNTAGNIMSRYTSDIDTLRQMISQSIPQCASSLVTIVVVFVGMLQTSWVLTIVMLFTVTGIVFVTMKVAGKSAKYFVGQQQSLGALNGYVEEMVNGQKVVKVFTHEEACKEQFDKLNEELCRNARIAGTLSNMMGPINNNLGYVQYAILAIVGGALCVLSGGNIDVSFIHKIVEKGLITRCRQLKFSVLMPDAPGALEHFSHIVAQQNANIILFQHDRVQTDLEIGEAIIHVVCEVGGVDHAKRLIDTLTDDGYKVFTSQI